MRRHRLMVHASRTFWTSLALGLGLLGCLTGLAPAADGTARVEVYFSPRGGATEAVIRAVNAATQQILVQAYSFTSAPIAKALVDAHKRGVHILAVLDTSNETGTVQRGDVSAQRWHAAAHRRSARDRPLESDGDRQRHHHYGLL